MANVKTAQTTLLATLDLSAGNLIVGDRVVLFDDVCVLCSAWANFLLKNDTDAVFRLASVQSPAGQAILQAFDEPLTDFTTMYLLEVGAKQSKLYFHSTAFIRVVGRLPLPWRAASAGWLIPRPVRDVLYRLVARNRYKLFGKREACYVPSAADKGRFLELEC